LPAADEISTWLTLPAPMNHNNLQLNDTPTSWAAPEPDSPVLINSS
jgi:hypothetical protein